MSAEYVAVLVLVAALTAALLSVGMPRVVGEWADHAACALFDTGEAGCEQPTTAAGGGVVSGGSTGGEEQPARDAGRAVPPRRTALTEVLAGAPAGALEADDYRELAVEYVRSLLPDEDPDDIYARNRAVTRAYAELYFLDPELYKWAGMAAFASDLVGSGIRQAEAARLHGGPPIPGVSDFSFTELSRALQYGNALVFTDIYWQHVAYHHGGIDALRRAHEAGELHDTLYEGWLMIDAGRRRYDPELVWAGNANLLYYEQRVTLQEGVYDQHRRMFQRLSGPIGHLQPMGSPVPGHETTFQEHVPGGDLGDPDDRWAWISDSMLPAWRQREAELTDELWGFVR